MTITTVLHPGFYVYVLLREDGATPFYVGMGRGDRWLQHEREATKGRSHRHNIILRMRANGIMPIPKIKLADNMDKAQATQLEIDLIRLIGRLPNGPLVNKTAGGEGLFDPSDETRKKMGEAHKRRVCTQETRNKLSRAAKGRKIPPHSAERRAKIAATVRGFKHTPEAKEKISRRSKQMRLTPERIEKLRASHLGVPMPPHVKEALARANRERLRSPEEIEKRVAAARGRKQ